MVGPNPFKVGSFAELKHFAKGPLRVRCDSCRRFRQLLVTEALKRRDYRSTCFRCSSCGARSYVAIERPDRNPGMADYQLEPCPLAPDYVRDPEA